MPHAGPWNIGLLQELARLQCSGGRASSECGREVLTCEATFEGEPWLGRATQVFGYYSRPANIDQRVPGIVLVHGGGGTAMPEWTELWAGRGYAALALDLYGMGADGQRLPDGGCDWSDLDIAFRLVVGVENGWIYQCAANIMRAISALAGREEVDSSRLALTGVSWGGILTTLVMGLDDRLKCAIPVYGFCFSPYTGLPPNASPEETRLIQSQLDPRNYLDRCKAEVLWVNGTEERHNSMDQMLDGYRLAGGTLSYTIRPNHCNPRWADRGWAWQEVHRFTDSVLRGTPELCNIELVDLSGEEAMLSFESPCGTSTVAAHWTFDVEADWERRQWNSAFGERIDARRWIAKLPKGQKLLFFTHMDRRGCIVSSEPIRSDA